MKPYYATVSACVILAAATTTPAAEVSFPVVVHLTSGRTFAGDIGPQTDAAELWLLSRRGSIAVLRPIAWDSVLKASVVGQNFSGEELRGTVEKLRAELPQPQAARPPRSIVLRGSGSADEALRPGARVGRERGTSAAANRVHHLAIDVSAGRWSDSVEQDGLVVHVYPLDAQGRIIQVWGSLEVQLKSWRLGNPYRPQPFFTVGQWSEKVRPDDFGAAGAVYELPYQAVRPETDLTVANQGLVHARLSVPGQGTFDASQDPVTIRPFSPVRDTLQQVNGQRFFREEVR